MTTSDQRSIEVMRIKIMLTAISLFIVRAGHSFSLSRQLIHTEDGRSKGLGCCFSLPQSPLQALSFSTQILSAIFSFPFRLFATVTSPCPTQPSLILPSTQATAPQQPQAPALRSSCPNTPLDSQTATAEKAKSSCTTRSINTQSSGNARGAGVAGQREVESAQREPEA